MFLFRRKPPPPWVSAVVAAAGSASRMEGIDKQQAAIDEVPVVVRSVEALSASPLVAEIVLVCPADLIPQYYALVRQWGLDLVTSVVGGGENRQQSVFAGIAACNREARFYLIHDGARPLASPEVIDDCIHAAFEHGAAAVGVPLKDTIKTVSPDGFITSTPERDGLVAIQTPQVFQAELYREAMALAIKEGRHYTDDCRLVERTGKKIRVTQGSYENIKITTPEDLAVAGALLRYREEGLEQWQLIE